MARTTKIIRTKGWSYDKWASYRQAGIGGSEAAVAMSAYLPELAETLFSSAVQLFLEKINEPVPIFRGNRWSMSGVLLEPVIRDLYKYYDESNPDFEQTLRNKEAGEVFSRVRDTKTYIINSKWNWLFGSVDGLILGENGSAPKILECKNTTFMMMDKFEQTNPSHYLQCQTYLLLYEKCEYAELCQFQDGNDLKITRIYPDKEHQEKIVYYTALFWKDVLEARRIKKEYNIDAYFGLPLDMFNSKQLEGVALLQALEPEIKAGSRDLDFVKQMIKQRPEEIETEMSKEVFGLAVKITELNKLNRENAKEKDSLKSKLLLALDGYTVANATKGKVSYKRDAKGFNRIYISPTIIY